jgi:hypothetical protein
MSTCLYCGATLNSRTARFCPGHHRPYRRDLIYQWNRTSNEEIRRDLARKFQRFPGWWDYENECPVVTGTSRGHRSIASTVTSRVAAPAPTILPVEYSFRKFGIELETASPSAEVFDSAIELANASGINVHNNCGYTHTTTSYWKVVTDSSLSGNYCREIVSPAFETADGIQEVTKMASILTTLGVKVNNSCGFHVHLDASDLTPRQIARVVKFYQAYETEIDKLHQGTRRGDARYTHTLAGKRIPENPTSINSVTSAIGTRYVKVNVEAYLRHGTLEFRQHGATVDPLKIAYWVKFCTRVIAFAKTDNVIDTRVALFDALNMDRDERLYWQHRMKVLRSA